MVSVDCSTGLNGAATLQGKWHEDDRYEHVDGEQVDKLPYDQIVTFSVLALAPGEHTVQMGDRKKIDADDPIVKFTVPECAFPTAPSAKCNVVTIPDTLGVDYLRITSAGDVPMPPGKHKVTGKTASFKAIAKTDEYGHPLYELVGDTAWTIKLSQPNCAPKPQLITLKVQADAYRPVTKAQAMCLARLDNDGWLKYREDSCLWGHSKHQVFTVRVPKHYTAAQFMRAVNARTSKAVGDVHTTAHLARAVVGRTVTVAWVMNPKATAGSPWGPGHNLNQRFAARG